MPSDSSPPPEVPKRKVGRPLGCKDTKPRKYGSGAWQKSRSTNTKPDGCFRSYRPHPSRPYYTSLYHETDHLEMKLTSHQKKVIETYNPLGQFEEPRENPFKVSFK